MKINLNNILRHIHFILFLFFVLSTYGTALFLYHEFYNIKEQCNIISDLKNEVVFEKIDIEKFDEIIKKITYKTERENKTIINNPFK